MGTLAVYNLGQLGVNVDKDPIQLEDGELATAQNVIPNPIGEGGIVNRHGLVKLNSAAAADTSVGIVGGVGVPLPFARRVYIAQFSGGGATWLTSANAFATAATQASVPAATIKTGKLTGSFSNAITSSNGATYGKTGVNYGNTIIYATDNYTQGTTSPTIASYDGSMDRLLLTVPTNPSTGLVPQAVMWLLVNNGYLYFSVHDTGTNAGVPTFVGSVYSYNLTTNIITKLGATFATQYLPYTLCWSNDRLWCGVTSFAGNGNTGKVYWIRPGVDTTWTLDKTFAVDVFPTTMLSFNGELYVGTYTTAAVVNAIVQKRTTAGVWSTVDTAGGTVPTGENWYAGAIQFGTSLYIGYIDLGAPTAPKIRKFDGTTWSTVKTAANAVIYNASFTDNGVLYFWSVGTSNTETFLTSANGSAWTDRTTNITAGGNRPNSGAAVIVS